MSRVFLLSPANAGGERARMVLNERAGFDLAVRLRREGAPLGDVFSFMSGLYFRGKLAYARAFASPPPDVAGAYVITSGQGLLPPETVVRIEDLLGMAGVPIDAADPRYREPLDRDTQGLRAAAGEECEFVLLGSIATQKYLEPLVRILGDRLLYPVAFPGRGDMSRGSLLLRAAHSGVELEYEPLGKATRHGPRPPRLPGLSRG